jgi:hypothetical protein
MTAIKDAAFLTDWASKIAINRRSSLPLRVVRYIEAIQHMDHEQLCLFLALALIIGHFELPPFPDEE